MVLPGCSQKGSCCLQHFWCAEINKSIVHVISWETVSLNDHLRLYCYTTNIRNRTWQLHEVLMLLMCLLSVLIFAKLWFFTILDMPAGAPLLGEKASAQSFAGEKCYAWKPSVPKVPHLLQNLQIDVIFFFPMSQILPKETQSDLSLHDYS